MKSVPTTQVPGVHRIRIGDAVVTSVNDGYLTGSFDLTQGIDAASAERIMKAAFQPGPPLITINAYAVHLGGKLVLIDTGAGTSMGATAGRVAANLEAAGIAPEAVDLILLTHLHPDHAGGLIDAHGKARFPNAELRVHAKDAGFWLDADTTAKAPAEAQPFFIGAQTAVAPYRDRMQTFTDGEVAPGIVAEPLPGHTPGHSGFRVQSGRDSLLIWGDIVHLPVLQSARPEVTMVYDTDPEGAKASRVRMFDMAASDGLLVAGMHMAFPGAAHVIRDGSGYRFVQTLWVAAL